MLNISIDRREFLIDCGKALAAAAVVPSMIGSCFNPSSSTPGNTLAHTTITLDITKQEYSSLATVGGAIKIPDPNSADRPMIVSRISGSSVAAFSSRCTHMGFEVPLPSDNLITCDYHGSQYDISGNVLRGPATSNLKKYSAAIQGAIITIVA